MAAEHAIYAVTFFDHHETKGSIPESAWSKITIWGRLVGETADYLKVEIVHTDFEEEMFESRPVNSVWFVVKKAVISKRKIGIWKHP